ncbi:MAG: serine/threonine-protein kinase, partial [Planctomycetota bacterium]
MSGAQDLALAAVAKRSKAVDDAALDRARAEKGALATALVKTGALTQRAVADLLAELVRMRFRCAVCGVEIKYEGLGRLEDLACDRCHAALEPVPERARLRSGVPPALRDADRFGAYKVGDVLGRGSMGVVYRCKKDGEDREYALKVMRPGETDPVAVARFAREAEVAARIEHPNVVRVLDQGATDGSFYYVMELCRGRTLQARIMQGAIPPQEAAKLVRDIGDAVAAAHRAGVIHRDLKPANVILEE